MPQMATAIQQLERHSRDFTVQELPTWGQKSWNMHVHVLHTF